MRPILFLSWASALVPSLSVRVAVDTTAPRAVQSREHAYICATMDWWPPNKCDSADGTADCAWVDASANTAPITGDRLAEAVRALGEFTLRIGGTLADSVTYAVGADEDIECPTFSPAMPTKARLFTGGCLTARRWEKLQSFCQRETGCAMLFGINAMVGRECFNVDPSRAPCFYPDAQCTSTWNPSNAEALIRATVASGYPIQGWELGNELSCLSPEQFAESLYTLNAIVTDVHSEEGARDLPYPFIVATDAVSGEPTLPADLLPLVEDFLYAYSWHSYPLGPGVDCTGYGGENNTSVDAQIMDPAGMDAFIAEAAGIDAVTRRATRPIQAWMGETGGAYDSGCNGSTNAFMSGFWYLNALGAFAAEGHHMFCRQTLIGGNYELVNKVTNIPNPDYYSTLLFGRLMGPEVLEVSVEVGGEESFRAYAHCTRDSRPESGSVTVLMLNYASKNISATVASGSGLRMEYILTGVPTDRSVDALHSDVVALNGRILHPDPITGKIPDLEPEVVVGSSGNVVLPPQSYAFVVYPNMKAHACIIGH